MYCKLMLDEQGGIEEGPQSLVAVVVVVAVEAHVRLLPNKFLG